MSKAYAIGPAPAGGPPSSRLSGALAILLLSLLALCASAGADLYPGHYTDYTYSNIYASPAPPAPLALNCSFFHPNDNACSVLQKIAPADWNTTTLALIRSGSPEEDQDWVRYWNSELRPGPYYENASNAYAFAAGDGAWGENGSLRNVWLRVIDLFPAVLDEKDNAYYLPEQVLVNVPVQVQFVVPAPANGSAYCAQNYHIQGYDYQLTRSVGNFTTNGVLLPVSHLLAPGQKANLSVTLAAQSNWGRDLWAWESSPQCDSNGCNATNACQLASSEGGTDTVNLTQNVTIKAYPTYTDYDNRIAVPKAGFAQGLAHVHLPADFLYYTISVKGESVTVRKNDLAVYKRGDVWPVLDLHLIAAPGQSGTLHVTTLNETQNGTDYDATIRYQLLVSTPDLGTTDCNFTWASPFQTYTAQEACTPGRTVAVISVNVPNDTGKTRRVIAQLHDQLGNALGGEQLQFNGLNLQTTMQTDQTGQTFVEVPVAESSQTVVVSVVGSADVAGASATAFIPGAGAGAGTGGATTNWLALLAPTVLIIGILIGLMVWLRRRRSAFMLLPLMLLLAVLASPLHAQDVNSSNFTNTSTTSILAPTTSALDIQATLTACQNYDFDNAVRHFGECAEAYRLSSEFNALRQTAGVLVAQIAPLVVANPDVAPYKPAYANMVLIALALFRVAWAFNSLYLILNIFNPARRSEALKQYGWLIVFVVFVYGSFLLLQNAVGLVNAISTQVAGPEAAQTLQQATVSVNFVIENYEMLQMILPLLHLTYLILLARYITVIGMILFFPFTLLLFFTSATRGFGRAALTVTFASLGLGVLNAILLLIYNILVKTADPTLSGTFASTFFSASFIVFFGFVNLLVLTVAFLSGIIFIGQSKVVEG